VDLFWSGFLMSAISARAGGDIVIQDDQGRRILEADSASMLVEFGFGPFESMMRLKLQEGLFHQPFKF
jgi:hypothetical protein